MEIGCVIACHEATEREDHNIIIKLSMLLTIKESIFINVVFKCNYKNNHILKKFGMFRDKMQNILCGI